jgi:hypothetical protein
MVTRSRGLKTALADARADARARRTAFLQRRKSIQID